MKFPGAYEGIKKIRRAQILDIISGVLALVLAVIAIVAAFGEDSGKVSDEFLAAAALAVAVLTIVILILGLCSFFIELSGLGKAANDEENFKKARMVIFVAILASLIASILSSFHIGSDMITELASIISKCSSIIVVTYVCAGAGNLLEELGKPELAEQGKKVASIIAIAFLLSTIADAIPTFLGKNDITDLINGICSLIATVLSLIGTFSYIGFLKRTTNAME